jgi:hypothetical protein
VYFSQLLNVHKVHDVRQIEILTTETRRYENEIATATLKRYKSAGQNETLQNLLKHEVKHCGLRSINSLILFEIKKSCLIRERIYYCTNLR